MGSKSVLPLYLKRGDFVTLVAPSSAFESTLFTKAVGALEKMGLNVRWRQDIFERQDYLAGEDQRRFSELQSALNYKKNKAVFVARGGYGSMRLLLKHKQIKVSKPLVLMGMSDVTCLLNWIPLVHGFSTIHGPVLAGSLFHSFDEEKQVQLFSGLFEPQSLALKSDTDYTVARSGDAKGILVGGNLAMIESALATPWDLNLRDRILFLEDIHEPRYKLDRMLTHLALAGKFKRLKGLVLGDFSDPHEKDHDPLFLEKLVKGFVPQHIPILQGLRVGHHRCDFLLPLGQVVEIKSKGKKMIIPPCVGTERG